MPNLDVLTGLRDVEGIVGSFVVSSRGELVGRDLPPLFDDETLHGVIPRLLRLRDGVAADGVEPTALVLRYAEHKLHVRTVGAGLLCVLSESKVNTPALRVGMRLVARRVASLVDQPARAPEPVLAPSRPATAPPPNTQRSVAASQPSPRPAVGPAISAPPSAEPKSIIYRGRKIPV